MWDHLAFPADCHFVEVFVRGEQAVLAARNIYSDF